MSFSQGLAIDLDIIERNTAAIVAKCAALDIEIMGVTKACCGSPMVARAMLAGGVTSLGESRIDNAKRLRHAGIVHPLCMLRIPAPSEALDIVELFDQSLNSEENTLRELSAAATALHRTHGIVLMLEIGDRREGVNPEELSRLCALTNQIPNLRLDGIGVNFMCVNGVLPSEEKMQFLNDTLSQIEKKLGVSIPLVSGGSSINLMYLAQMKNSNINQLRIGASILRGENALTGEILPWLEPDAFLLRAELIEIQRKDSMPEGAVGLNAFGKAPVTVDKGIQRRGIVNLGQIDIRAEDLEAVNGEIEVISASSDHLITSLGDADVGVGDSLAFRLGYAALIQAMLSPYVVKKIVTNSSHEHTPKAFHITAPTSLKQSNPYHRFITELEALGFSANKSPVAMTLQISADRNSEPTFSELNYGVLCLDAEPGDISAFTPDTTALLGLQRADPAARAQIRERCINAMTMEDIDFHGALNCMIKALRTVTNGTEGFALVLHTSVGGGMNPEVAAMGLSYRECALMMERISASEKLRAVTISGLNEHSSEQCINRAFDFVLTALGKTILG